MLIYYYFIEIITVVTFVFICCWIDRYIIRRICKKPNDAITRDIARDRIVTMDGNEGKLNEEDTSQTSGESSYYSTENDSDEETTDEETINEIRMLKPDYDEETENEYGESLNNN